MLLTAAAPPLCARYSGQDTPTLRENNTERLLLNKVTPPLRMVLSIFPFSLIMCPFRIGICVRVYGCVCVCMPVCLCARG